MGQGVYAIVLDGPVDKELIRTAEKGNVRHVVGMDSKISSNETRINVITEEQL